MSGFHGTSDFVKLGFFLVIGTWCFIFITFFAPYWTTRPNGYAGLWEACTEGICYDRWNQWVEDWIKATQAFVLLSLIIMSWALVMNLFFIFHKSFEADKRLIFLTIIAVFTTSLFMFLAICIWGGSQYNKSGEKLNWCYVFAVTSMFSAFASGVLFTIELRTPIQLGEDQENLLFRAAEPEFKPLPPGYSQSVLALDTTNNKTLNMSMKSGLNTSSYPLV